MQTAINATLIIVPILYTLLVMAYARVFTRGPEGLARHTGKLLISTVLLNLVSILLRGLQAGACPLGDRMEFMALVAFGISATYLALELRFRVASTGLFAVTLAGALQLVASIGLLEAGPPPPLSMGALDSIHSFAAVVAIAAAGLSGVYAILYLFLYWAIKRGKFGLFFRKMPPLETLSELNYGATGAAFLALTITAAVGYGRFFGSSGTRMEIWNIEVILSSALWLLYGGSILARQCFGLGGKRLAYTTVLGLVLIAGILFGGLFTPGFHG